MQRIAETQARYGKSGWLRFKLSGRGKRANQNAMTVSTRLGLIQLTLELMQISLSRWPNVEDFLLAPE